MQTCDVLVVGGGPAGSSCAWALNRLGMDVLVADKALFPRDKVCAGWITPAVFTELEIDPVEYGRERTCQPITAFRVGRIDGAKERKIDYGRAVSYGIRRSQFDHYLLDRCGARLSLGQAVRSVQRVGRSWVVDDRIRTPMLVAAGGHFCPVARMLNIAGRRAPIVAAQEVEFLMHAPHVAACQVEPDVPELHFCSDFLGYGWCFRKGDFLNIGLGREDRARIGEHSARFCDWLRRRGRIPANTSLRFRGHAYYLRGRSPRNLRHDGLLVVGDAAGLAYAYSGEGIRPAIESGLIAARVISAANGDYSRDRLQAYEEEITARLGPCKREASRGPAVIRRLLATGLLRTSWSVRHIVLDRWFLRTHQPRLQWDL